MSQSITLAALIERLGGEGRGDLSVAIQQIAPIERAGAGELAFVAQAKYRAALATTRAAALILPPALADAHPGPRVITPDPYLYFARAAQLLNPPLPASPGVHPSAVVESELPPSVSVGPLAYVGPDCVVGERVIIGAAAVVGSGVCLGDDTRLHPRATLYPGCVVGARCIVHAGAVIGSDGFGYARNADKRWEKIPQIGGVRIGDDVEIGANTAIDRGALDDTVIADGVKLDNLIQIAHNCVIGRDSALAACVGLAGSTVVGERVTMAGQAGVVGHVRITDDVFVTARAMITKDITAPGAYGGGIPQLPAAEWLRNAVHFRHLDEMADRIRALERRLAELEKSA